MTPTIQDTLLQLFDNVRQDPDTLPTVPIEDWQEGSVEWSLLSGFHDMLEQVQQRMNQFRQMEQQLREREEQYRSIFEAHQRCNISHGSDDGHVVEANPAACSMYWILHMRSLSACHLAAVVPPDYLPVVNRSSLQTLSGRGAKRPVQGVNLRKDGSVVSYLKYIQTAFHLSRQTTSSDCDA